MEDTQLPPMKVMPVESCKAMGKMYSNPSDFKSRMNSHYREPSMLSIANFALAQLEAARAENLATHEKNLPALEMNARIVEYLTTLMTAIGMPEGWSERDPSSRARTPRTIRHQAGWRTDIAKHCATSDGFDLSMQAYENTKVKYQQYHAQALLEDERKQSQAARELAAKLEKRKADLDFITILQRYNLPIESEWSDVLEALRQRDQRLDLAIAMEDVRGDWNEGCGAVENALSRFSIKTDEDKDIANDVLGCTRDFEDGRVFRDTEWSYGALYASVADRQLVADAEIARKHCRDY